MDNFLHSLSATLHVTAPVFIIVFLGIIFRRINWLDEHFVKVASALVFRVTLPTLVFLNISKTDLRESLDPGVIIYACTATLISFFFLIWMARKIIQDKTDHGVFIQGSFRGNQGVIGMALVANQFGAPGMPLASILLGSLIIIYNILSVIALSMSLPGRADAGWKPVLKEILKNPLILSVVAAIPVSLLKIELPAVVLKTGEYFSGVTLPLALLCIGASLSLKALRASSLASWSATLMKLLILPVIMTLGAIALGWTGQTLGILFLYFASPTAAGSFVMVKAMGGNDKLAANIVALTTAASTLTITLGVFLLHWQGLV
ncbi:AEC family transporter [Oceanospirillum sediminis]|uniref:AEC family transporter n=1 Tax=Oceanospirillum sediminis TaxID=2760088 RepID=A0A839IS46_9GAMM|nr:AEC family transporter [Oceanospirillum sediminis]MBB1487016.1 AEC family transporter [Oceanospirillum sediminis]